MGGPLWGGTFWRVAPCSLYDLKPLLGPVIDAMPSVNRWLTAVRERDAVWRGMAAPKV